MNFSFVLGGLLERIGLDLTKYPDDFHHENEDCYDDDDEIHDPAVEISC